MLVPRSLEFVLWFTGIRIKTNFVSFHSKIVVKNPCTKTTCQNGGTCYADILSNAQCFCEEGFEGKFCEIDKRPTVTTATTTKATMAPSSKFDSIHSWNKTFKTLIREFKRIVP